MTVVRRVMVTVVMTARRSVVAMTVVRRVTVTVPWW